jgi:orotidine-5'-phosphate decarboxylase
VAAIDALGAWCVTVHATGGSEMVEAAVGASEGVKVIAVTVLTSLDGAAMERVGLAGPPADAVLRLAELALGAGAHGLVCSPLEAALLRARFGAHEDGGPILVVPGVRPGGEASHDQKRVASPAEAIAAGADVIVVGRPITRSSDPAAAAAAVAREAGR